MKKINKYTIIIVVLFLTNCNGGCWFSDGCSTGKALKRAEKMTNEERRLSRQQCSKVVQDMIDRTTNEKRQCNFWRCMAGKESFREDLRRCHTIYRDR